MLIVGTSGWQYRHWKRVFYPDKLPQRLWLPYYAERFQTVEVNNTFYNLPEVPVFEQWAKASTRDFVFALKMSRYLTHLKRLRDPRAPVERFMGRAAALGDKRGPILLQLPPSMLANTDLLDAALSSFASHEHVAVEFRHPSWFTDEVAAVLVRHRVALCVADSPARKQPLWRTADWTFLRFHEGEGSHAPGYERDVLQRWVAGVAEMWKADDNVYVYFNNDWEGYAIRDAITFADLAARAGLRPTRVPASAAV